MLAVMALDRPGLGQPAVQRPREEQFSVVRRQGQFAAMPAAFGPLVPQRRGRIPALDPPFPFANEIYPERPLIPGEIQPAGRQRMEHPFLRLPGRQAMRAQPLPFHAGGVPDDDGLLRGGLRDVGHRTNGLGQVGQRGDGGGQRRGRCTPGRRGRQVMLQVPKIAALPHPRQRPVKRPPEGAGGDGMAEHPCIIAQAGRFNFRPAPFARKVQLNRTGQRLPELVGVFAEAGSEIGPFHGDALLSTGAWPGGASFSSRVHSATSSRSVYSGRVARKSARVVPFIRRTMKLR